MRARSTRLGLVLALLLGSSSSVATPPATAAGSGVLVVQGVLTMGPGIAYPCLGSGFFGIDLGKCLGRLTSNNTATIDFSGAGIGFFSYSLDPKCLLCGEGIIYTISAAGMATGACGLSTGTLNGTIGPGVPLGTKFQKSRSLMVTFTETGGAVAVTGTTSTGAAGKTENVVGSFTAVPNPANGGSCTNKQSKTFIVNGSLTFLKP